MPAVFINKLTKTFMDAIYGFLDGLVLLTTEDSPNMKGPDKVKYLRGTAHEMRLHNLLDLRDAVCNDPFWIRASLTYLPVVFRMLESY